MNLDHKLKSLGIKDPEERLTLSRYIIEPRSENRIRFEENREISKDKAEKILKSKIEEYKTYENEEEQLKLRFRELLGRYSSTLRDSLELEDLRECGYIPATTLKGWFLSMDINLDSDLLEYLIFVSATLDKIYNSDQLLLEYSKITDIVEEKDNQFEEQDNQFEVLKKTNGMAGNNEEDRYSDDYGNDFEDSGKIKSNSQDLIKDEDKDENQPQETEPQRQTEGEGELDQEIDDEQMISIAENWLIRIAEELLNK